MCNSRPHIYSTFEKKIKKERKFLMNASLVFILLGFVSFFPAPFRSKFDKISDDTSVRDKIMKEAIDIDDLEKKESKEVQVFKSAQMCLTVAGP